MILLVISLCIFVSAFLLVYSWESVIQGPGTNRLLNSINRLTLEYDETLKDLFVQGQDPKFLAWVHYFRHAIAFLVGYLFLNLGIAILLAISAHFAPRLLIDHLRKRRWERFDDQISDSINMLASSTRAGMTLVQAVETVAANMPAPSSQEFRLMMNEYEHGHPLVQVLENARKRISTDNFNIVSTAIIVNREKGGNLTEVLEKIATAVREISRLEKKIRTETSSVRFSANIMMFMPLVIGFLFYLIEPESISLLFNHPIGNVILCAVVVLNFMAYMAIRKIINVEL